MARTKFSKLGVEDNSKWQELPRSPEVKRYAAAERKFWIRNLLMRIVSFAIAYFIAMVIDYVAGTSSVIKSVTHDEVSKVALIVSLAWLAGIIYFADPLIKIFRPRLSRVSEKTRPNQSEVFDQDA